jgi:hypothetical protein
LFGKRKYPSLLPPPPHQLSLNRRKPPADDCVDDYKNCEEFGVKKISAVQWWSLVINN